MKKTEAEMMEEAAARRIMAAMRSVAKTRGYEIIGTVQIKGVQTGNVYSFGGRNE